MSNSAMPGDPVPSDPAASDPAASEAAVGEAAAGYDGSTAPPSTAPPSTAPPSTAPGGAVPDSPVPGPAVPGQAAPRPEVPDQAVSATGVAAGGPGVPAAGVPDQTVPAPVVPGQPVRAHAVPDQVAPDQVAPDQVAPHLVAPDLVAPDQGTPGLGEPHQVVPGLGTPGLGAPAAEVPGLGVPGLGVPGGEPDDRRELGLTEKTAFSLPGWPMAGAIALLGAVGIVLFGIGTGTRDTPLTVAAAVLALAAFGLARGLTPVAPGQARVVQLLGRYTGTIRDNGLHWVNPATARLRVSTRIRNHETAVAKVNDADGNPIEMAAVVVWRVHDTAKAAFGVDDLAGFVATQAETAVRHVATAYPYDAHRDGQMSLRDNAQEITMELAAEISNRVAPAGVQIVESRISRLSYAPEIAQAMLRRQQASAVVAARQRIVDGAVGMVEAALARLDAEGLVDLDPERRAAMVSNLLVVLCSEQPAQPVVNTGTLYQ
jgi:regulator of protease activity HflC (stomatin/prohibitin superfamily)